LIATLAFLLLSYYIHLGDPIMPDHCPKSTNHIIKQPHSHVKRLQE
jgi:hypothetical protein